MKISVSYRGLHAHDGVEKEVARNCAKVQKLLKSFQPDLVQLHAAVEFLLKKNQYSFSLNLILPTVTLHAASKAKNVRATVRTAFAEIEKQVKKHKDRLRHDHDWKRKRGGELAPAS
jgi:ribosome-associated translation inhibitor RaiA